MSASADAVSSSDTLADAAAEAPSATRAEGFLKMSQTKTITTISENRLQAAPATIDAAKPMIANFLYPR